MKKFVVLFVLLVALNSCREGDDFKISSDPTKVDARLIQPKVEQGYLVFASAEEIMSLLSDSERPEVNEKIENWQKLPGFTSYKEYRIANTEYLVNEEVLALRKALNNRDISIIKQSVKSLPLSIEAFINEKGLVRIGSTLLQFTPDNVKELKNFNGQLDQIVTLITSTEDSPKNNIRFQRIFSGLNKVSDSNARIGPYSVSVVGGPLPIPPVGSMFVHGYLTCYSFPSSTSSTGYKWYIDAESRAYSNGGTELTGVQTSIEVTSSTHGGRTVTGKTRQQNQILGSRGSDNNNDFKGQIKFVITMYPYGYTLHSVGYINITD
jgi:hypothetical protein